MQSQAQSALCLLKISVRNTIMQKRHKQVFPWNKDLLSINYPFWHSLLGTPQMILKTGHLHITMIRFQLKMIHLHITMTHFQQKINRFHITMAHFHITMTYFNMEIACFFGLWFGSLLLWIHYLIKINIYLSTICIF